MFIEVRNPVTGRTVGRVEASEAQRVSDSVARARQAQIAWAGRSFRERAKVVRRFYDRILDRRVQILDVIQAETGKARRDALAEVVIVAGTARYYLAHGRRYLSDKRRSGAVPVFTHAEVVHKPHGTVGLIAPWNYPLILSVGDAIPALLAGNAVVVKPSELTPLSAVLARDLLVESGLDPDLFILIHGGGDAGAELIRHVDYIGFTGAVSTGRKVAIAASERLIPYSLELGGKNPMIVLEGAPIGEAVKGLLAGAFSNSGQTCISVERVYVQDSIFDRFAERLVDGTRNLKLGWSESWDIDMGSLISEAHAQKVMTQVEGAKAKGAEVLAGGKRRVDIGPAFVEPTVLTGVSSEADLFRHETFGPVVALYRVRDVDDALAHANDSEFGLNASVWAAGSTQARSIARRLETGSAAINSALLIYSSFDVPMGGVKQSGIGRRHSEQGILRYTQTQSIVASSSIGGGFDALALSLRSERAVNAVIAALRLWGRFS